jgi:hypothetical protein
LVPIGASSTEFLHPFPVADPDRQAVVDVRLHEIVGGGLAVCPDDAEAESRVHGGHVDTG